MTMTPGTQTLPPGRSAPGTRPLVRPTPRPERPPFATRVTVDGVHLACGSTPFRVRGVTYGSFLPRADGAPFPAWERCRADLMAIAESGLNTVRTYDVPPPEILELAAEAGLRVIVGLQYADWRMLPPPGRPAERRVLEFLERARAGR